MAFECRKLGAGHGDPRAGVFDRDGGGAFVSPYPFLIEREISVIRGHGGEDHPEPALNWSTARVQPKPRECLLPGEERTCWRRVRNGKL